MKVFNYTDILDYVWMSAWNSLLTTILGYVWMSVWNSLFTTILGYGRSCMKIHEHTVCPKMVHFAIGNIFVILEVQQHEIHHWIGNCVVLSVIITIIRSVIITQWLFA